MKSFDLAARGALLPKPISAGAFLADLPRRLSNDMVWYSCIGLVLALQVALVLSHDPWLDEWQALLIALPSMALPALFENRPLRATRRSDNHC